MSVTILQGDALALLQTIESESVQVVCTSPPYFGLRAYGTNPQVWGGDPECRHAWVPTGHRIQQPPVSDSTTLKSPGRQKATPRPKPSPKAGAFTSQVGASIPVHETGERSTTRDAQINTERAATGPDIDGESVRPEQSGKLSGESFTATGERRAASLIDVTVSIEDTAHEAPEERIGDGRQADREALAGGETKAAENRDESTAVDRPSVSRVAGPRRLDTDRGLGGDEVADESRTALVQTDETHRSGGNDVAIGQHQPEEVGEVITPDVKPIEHDRVSVVTRADAPVVSAAHGTERFFAHAPVPVGAAQHGAAPNASHFNASIGAGNGASSPESDARRADMERGSTGGALDSRHTSMVCEKCGAIKCELGQEPTPALFIDHLVTIFDEVKRVLRPDATLWVNLGDSYSGSGKGPTGHNGLQNAETRQEGIGIGQDWNVPPKNLLLTPERFAIAMQDAGWVVRSRIAWCKTSAMPESVRDRPTSAWEHIFMFSKQASYFYDATAVAQPSKSTAPSGNGYARPERLSVDGVHQGSSKPWQVQPTSALRNFWLLGPEPSSEQHYASFPTAIPRRCIKAGTSERGQCPACGAPWVREVERPGAGPKFAPLAIESSGALPDGPGTHRNMGGRYQAWLDANPPKTTGWQPSCRCDAGDPVPQVVLDPFLGSGTTALVADQLGRHAVGIELNAAYCRLAAERIRRVVGPMFSEIETVSPTQLALLEVAT